MEIKTEKISKHEKSPQPNILRTESPKVTLINTLDRKESVVKSTLEMQEYNRLMTADDGTYN